MPTKKVLIIGGLPLSILVILSVGFVTATQVNKNQLLSLKTIAEKCKSSIDKDGFGHARIKASHIQDQSIKMNIPCRLELEEGSTLQLTNVSLETVNLFVTSEPDTKKPVHIVIRSSKFKSATGGIYIQLPTTSSSVDISNSAFSYPLSAGVSVGGEDDKNAALRVTNSSFSSDSRDSEGILLVSTGQAVFKNNEFSMKNPDEDILLVAQRCESNSNGRAIVHCQEP